MEHNQSNTFRENISSSAKLDTYSTQSSVEQIDTAISALEDAIENDGEQNENAQSNENENGKRRRRKKRSNVEKLDTAVYVNGLPFDTTEDEIAKYFAKCGFIKIDPRSGEKMVKLFRNKKNELNGDGLIVFHLRPSVELAITLLHDTDFRSGFKIAVEEVTRERQDMIEKFILENEQDNNGDDGDNDEDGDGNGIDHSELANNKLKKPRIFESKNGNSKVAKIKKLEIQQGLSWNEEGLEDYRGNKIVVLKNMFVPSDFDVDPNFLGDLEQDLVDECSTLGKIKKISVFQKNPLGVVMIKYHSAVAAENCIKLMNGRWFNERQIEAEYWDGETDYRTKMTEEEEKERLDKFGDWLEQE